MQPSSATSAALIWAENCWVLRHQTVPEVANKAHWAVWRPSTRNKQCEFSGWTRVPVPVCASFPLLRSWWICRLGKNEWNVIIKDPTHRHSQFRRALYVCFEAWGLEVSTFWIGQKVVAEGVYEAAIHAYFSWGLACRFASFYAVSSPMCHSG